MSLRQEATSLRGLAFGATADVSPGSPGRSYPMYLITLPLSFFGHLITPACLWGSSCAVGIYDALAPPPQTLDCLSDLVSLILGHRVFTPSYPAACDKKL